MSRERGLPPIESCHCATLVKVGPQPVARVCDITTSDGHSAKGVLWEEGFQDLPEGTPLFQENSELKGLLESWEGEAVKLRRLSKTMAQPIPLRRAAEQLEKQVAEIRAAFNRT